MLRPGRLVGGVAALLIGVAATATAIGIPQTPRVAVMGAEWTKPTTPEPMVATEVFALQPGDSRQVLDTTGTGYVSLSYRLDTDVPQSLTVTTVTSCGGSDVTTVAMSATPTMEVRQVALSGDCAIEVSLSDHGNWKSLTRLEVGVGEPVVRTVEPYIVAVKSKSASEDYNFGTHNGFVGRATFNIQAQGPAMVEYVVADDIGILSSGTKKFSSPSIDSVVAEVSRATRGDIIVTIIESEGSPVAISATGSSLVGQR